MTDTPTIEQVREMPAGPEMDALVATLVMGWEQIQLPAMREGGLQDEPAFQIPDSTIWAWQWTPSTDLNDAWRAATSLDPRGYACRAEVADVDGLCRAFCPGRLSDFVWAETPALALSRAALIAKLEAGT